jgi:hypothetical protein
VQYLNFDFFFVVKHKKELNGTHIVENVVGMFDLFHSFGAVALPKQNY